MKLVSLWLLLSFLPLSLFSDYAKLRFGKSKGILFGRILIDQEIGKTIRLAYIHHTEEGSKSMNPVIFLGDKAEKVFDFSLKLAPGRYELVKIIGMNQDKIVKSIQIVRTETEIEKISAKKIIDQIEIENQTYDHQILVNMHGAERKLRRYEIHISKGTVVNIGVLDFKGQSSFPQITHFDIKKSYKFMNKFGEHPLLVNAQTPQYLKEAPSLVSK